MLKMGFKAMLGEANAQIETVSAEQAREYVGDENILFVDVRETQEVESSGGLPGSVHVPRGLLEFIADPESPMHKSELSSGRQLVLYCASGGRSALAAKTLQDMGLSDVCHIAGGFTAWVDIGGPTTVAEESGD
jgi:rhodanese-related sulfurtransferase|tara:strand:- start:22 stop:423 length:402 start_codon:yes stop_codon:yes gene_type:complete